MLLNFSATKDLSVVSRNQQAKRHVSVRKNGTFRRKIVLRSEKTYRCKKRQYQQIKRLHFSRKNISLGLEIHHMGSHATQRSRLWCVCLCSGFLFYLQRGTLPGELSVFTSVTERNRRRLCHTVRNSGRKASCYEEKTPEQLSLCRSSSCFRSTMWHRLDAIKTSNKCKCHTTLKDS